MMLTYRSGERRRRRGMLGTRAPTGQDNWRGADGDLHDHLFGSAGAKCSGSELAAGFAALAAAVSPVAHRREGEGQRRTPGTLRRS